MAAVIVFGARNKPKMKIFDLRRPEAKSDYHTSSIPSKSRASADPL